MCMHSVSSVSSFCHHLSSRSPKAMAPKPKVAAKATKANAKAKAAAKCKVAAAKKPAAAPARLMAPANENARAVCAGNCEYGDEIFVGRKASLAYDGSRCTCIRCHNFDICYGWITPNFDIHQGICMTCDMLLGRMSFRLPPPGEVCCVCMGTERQARFKQCQHWCCGQCMRNIMFWDETRYHIDPCGFGCPPCPNGCENPARGEQCYCEEYDAVLDEWQRADPAQFQRFIHTENDSIAEGESPSSAFSSRRCPICRQPQ